MTPGASAALARRVAGHLVTAGAERSMGVDQTNVSVVVDEAVVVKWLTPPVGLPHTGLDIARHLAASGFVETPALLGSDERDGALHAIVSVFVAGTRDGWEWFTDDVIDWLDSGNGWEELLLTCRRLGELAARLHTALAGIATNTDDIAATNANVATIGSDGPADEHADDLATKAAATLRSAIEVVGDEDREWLNRLVPQIERSFERLADAVASRLQVCHGDLHVGQFLRDPAGGLWVVDFDGNPLGNGRSQRSPVEVDVAALMQSVDHVARVAHRRRPDAPPRLVESLAARGPLEVLAGYRSVSDAHQLRAEILGPLRVAQELHELLYAARHLPHWRYVPAAALPALLERLR